MTDIEITKQFKMNNIENLLRELNINDYDLYGKYKAKINSVDSYKDGKVVLVTAINPTPFGEGKTTVAIGIHDSMCKIGKSSMLVLREPSMGPVFGIKGGATGGGYSQIVPMEDINLHFTGDFHAITSANNLISASIDNSIYFGNPLKIKKVLFERCLDINDRTLRNVIVGYETKFNITAASEIMAILCLAKDSNDLRKRLDDIIIGIDENDNNVYLKSLGVTGALMVLLKDAIKPNLVQTLYNNPVLVHGGPFANIAHGCSSIVSTKLGLSLADYVITEAGFGSDLGAEKFLNIKCRQAKIKPSMVVIVATVRALEHSGIDNLQAHIDHLKCYNIPFCVTINQFFDDKKEDIDRIINYCEEQGVSCIVSNSYQEGGKGSINLAQYIIDNTGDDSSSFEHLYPFNMDVRDKLQTLANKVYHAKNIVYSDEALEKLDEIEKLGIGHYPICVSKTPFSISDDPKKLGYPKNYLLNVRDIIIQTGSRMIIILLGNVLTMPGLPKYPNYENME